MSTNQISREDVVVIAQKLADHYGVPFTDNPAHPFNSEGPVVVSGDHEESTSAWIVSWEEGVQFDWVGDDQLLERLVAQVADQFYPQALNHWCVAFYPRG